MGTRSLAHRHFTLILKLPMKSPFIWKIMKLGTLFWPLGAIKLLLKCLLKSTCLFMCTCKFLIYGLMSFAYCLAERNFTSWMVFMGMMTTMSVKFFTRKLAIWSQGCSVATMQPYLHMGQLGVEKLTPCRYHFHCFCKLKFPSIPFEWNCIEVEYALATKNIWE